MRHIPPSPKKGFDKPLSTNKKPLSESYFYSSFRLQSHIYVAVVHVALCFTKNIPTTSFGKQAMMATLQTAIKQSGFMFYKMSVIVAN